MVRNGSSYHNWHTPESIRGIASKQSMESKNPCLCCGACCALYRVSFYWGEAERSVGGVVPLELTEELTPFRLCMKGTSRKPVRCIALQGHVGEIVNCTIYLARPTSCREFGVTWSKGGLHTGPGELERCNRARAVWGLPPLSAIMAGEQALRMTFPIRS
jgi:uncharacterized protein